MAAGCQVRERRRFHDYREIVFLRFVAALVRPRSFVFVVSPLLRRLAIARVVLVVVIVVAIVLLVFVVFVLVVVVFVLVFVVVFVVVVVDFDVVIESSTRRFREASRREAAVRGQGWLPRPAGEARGQQQRS